MKKKQLVIVGGGFGGINIIMKLANHAGYHITLIDRNNYYFFPPLIYQVATGFLEPSSISYPFRKLFRNVRNISFRLGSVTHIDTANKICHLKESRIAYDHLVLAAGAGPNYFGNEQIMRNATPMKNIDDALHLKNVLLACLEKAALTCDLDVRKKLLTIVVAGGGPTGIELAGMLAELRSYTLKKDYPELEASEGAIYLVEPQNSLLAQMSPSSQRDATKALQRLGVIINTGTAVTDYTDQHVTLNSGERIPAEILIWTAGVQANRFDGIPEPSLDRNQRMKVNEYHQVIGLEEVYAIGDTCVSLTDPKWPKGHPQLAQVAIQQGKLVALNFKQMAAGKPVTGFSYVNKGTMAIIGRRTAVCDLAKPAWHFKGIIALALWLIVHLLGLLTFQNRIRTLYNWGIAYLTRDQSLRMIIRPERKANDTDEPID